MELEVRNEKDIINIMLDYDSKGVSVSLVDHTGEVIEENKKNIVDPKLQELIKEVSSYKSDSFFSGWEEEKKFFYAETGDEIKNLVSRYPEVGIVDKHMKPLRFKENSKVTLKIVRDEMPDFYKGKILIDNHDDFKSIENNMVKIKDKVCILDVSDEEVDILKELLQFEERVAAEEIESFLTLAYSVEPKLEIDFLGYSVCKLEEIVPTKELIIEKISSDNSLYIKVDAIISTLSYEFLKNNSLENIILINEEKEKIEIAKVDLKFLEEIVEEVFKSIMKYQKTLRLKYGVFTDGNFIILQEELAKEFITNELLQLAGTFKVVGTDNLKKYNIKTVKPKVVGKFTHGIDFLEGDIELDIEGEKFSIVDILNTFKKDSYIVLSDGTNALINKKYIEKLERVFKVNEKDGVKISFFDLPLIDELIEDKVLAEELKRTKQFYRGINNISSYNIEVPKIEANLREYQEYGYKWLSYLMDNELGGCLADDMGLGKTLQAITLITRLHSSKGKKTLVIMPKSLIYNWENEIKKFSPKLKCGIYYGNNREKTVFRTSEVVITTYGTVRNDIEYLREKKFDLIILDESQNIKNVNAQTTRAVMLLNSKYRLALSGTPIENNLSELYSLFRFLNPTMFGTLDEFNYHYANPIQKENSQEAIEELKKKIYPFILRRVKKEVLKDLPDKVEKVLHIGMSPSQKKLYEERRSYYYNLVHNQIKEQGIGKSKFYILQALNELRQLTSCPEMKNPNVISSKREVLINNVQDAVENGHKVLIFTNYIKTIESISKDLEARGIKYLQMSGATKDRQGLVDLFQKEEKYKVFVMTLKTGGVGLNLTAADTIFIYDPWWNKTVENQAIDRAYRLGQDRTVFSYKLILKDTIEEKILKLQESKSQLLDNLISDEGATLKSLTEKDIEFILGE